MTTSTTTAFDRVYRIGVDEIAYRKGRKFLTVVADHDTGRVMFVGEGRNQHVFAEFFEALGETGRARIEAVSMDMTAIYRKATTAHVPHAAICLDPFHVIKWAGEALDLAYNTVREQGVKISLDGLTHAETGAEGPRRPAPAGRETQPHPRRDHRVASP